MKTITVDLPKFSFTWQEYPAYLTQIINIACQNSQATRPKHIGSMKDLFCEWSQTGTDLSPDSWKEFYYDKKGKHCIDAAIRKIYVMTRNMISSVCLQCEESPSLQSDIARWVEQLVFEKTYTGMIAEMRVAKALADLTGEKVSLSDAKGEKDGIDILLGNRLIQIKPEKGGYSPSLFFNKVKTGCILVTYAKRGDKLDIFIREDETEIENR